MNPLPLRWKLFRIMCILQMLMIVYPLVSHVVSLFGAHFWLSLVHVSCYLFILLFLFLGLSLLNDNYPDTPFSPIQKRRFNQLFLLNFLLIAFLFSKVVNVWWILSLIFVPESSVIPNRLWLFINLTIVILSFIFHLLFLYGMYRLRVLIQNNTIDTWYNQFDQEAPNQ